MKSILLSSNKPKVLRQVWTIDHPWLNISHRPVILIAGRSNVGKSSLINALCQQTVAYTSKTPGRTQQFALYQVDFEHHKLVICDTPGYGYAKLNMTTAANIAEQFRVCLEHLTPTVIWLLIDIRHPNLPNDQQLIRFFLENNFLLKIILTKADKISSTQQQQVIQGFAKSLPTVRCFLFSVHDYRKVGELRHQLKLV